MAGQKHVRRLRKISVWPKSFKHSYLNMKLNSGDKTRTVNNQRIVWFRCKNNLFLKMIVFQRMNTLVMLGAYLIIFP